MRKHLLWLITFVLLALIPCTIVSAADSDIPEDAVTFNGHTYALYKKACTWTDAKQKCENAGGHLVTISSAAENKVVNTFAKSLGIGHDVVWIGLYKPQENGNWKWVTGENVYYTNFNYHYSPKEWGYVYMYGTEDDSAFGPDGVWHTEPPQDSIYDELWWAYVCEWDYTLTTVGAPKNVKASQPASNTIKLTWTNGKNAKKYAIWRAEGSGSDYVKIGETKKLVYTDKTVRNGKAYKYKIQAVNGSKTAVSSAVKAYPLTKPVGIKAKVVGKTSVSLSWKKVKGAKHYFIYQKGPKDSKFMKLKIDTAKTRVKIPVTDHSGSYKYYVVPAYGSFEGLKSKTVSVRVVNPDVN